MTPAGPQEAAAPGAGATAGREHPGSHRPAARFLTGDGPAPGWVGLLPPAPPARLLLGSAHADAVVLGAGLTGLAAARRLAELRPDWRIALVDGQRVGAGATGRSSGFVVELSDFAAEMAPAARLRFLHLSRLGIAQLRELVARHAIACDWNEHGFYRGAAGEPGVRLLERWPALLADLGVRSVRLDAAQLERSLGTSFYRAGLHLPGSVLVQPAALARGLAAALPANVDLYEESPVERIHRGPTFRLESDGGTVAAPLLLLATDGYTPLLGFLRRWIFPLLTFGSLTRTLSAAEQATLGGLADWGMLALDAMGSTVRRVGGGRFLVRNTVHYARDLAVGPRLLDRMRSQHRRALRARFPTLAAVELEATWSGVLGVSSNRQLYFGEVGDRLYAAAGFNGAGIAMGTAAGGLLAEHALGEDSAPLRDLRALPPPVWMPPEPFMSLGGWWKVVTMNAQAGARL